MSTHDVQLSFAALADEHRGEHASTEELIAYHADTLDPASAERLQDHLALCQKCTRALLDLDTFPDVEPLDETSRASATSLDAIRRGLLESLEDSTHPGVQGPNVIRLQRSLIGSRVAAVFFCMTTLVLWWQSSHSESPPQPTINAPIVSLKAQSTVRSGESIPLQLPPTADSMVIQLVFAEVTPSTRYSIHLLNADGEALWSTQSLERTPEGLLTLIFDRQFIRRQLSDGHYSLRLYNALADNPQEPLAEYFLEFRTDNE